uniref:Reverse transcriptase domain-containing protein n=1 Tax=Oryzias latipes TaxID=8090 RepID=A0A3P9LQY6_ORYLA
MPLLLRALNYTHKEGRTPPSWKDAIITLIPKENKDRQNCTNYRPISMLNVDYKIYTSILTKRFETFIAELIDEDQTGFVRGRQTQDNIRRSLHVIHTITKNKIKAALISLDAEKAFDRVNWDFLYQTLEKFGFTQNSIKCIKAIYDKPTARIKINGSLTDRFELKRGTRRGCGISPTLFALYIEPLAQAIRQCEELEGIKIDGREQKIGLFADDVLLFLKNINTSMPKLMTLLKEFNSLAGYKLNILKTQTLLFNHSPSEKTASSYNIKWDNKRIKYLGVFLPKNLSLLFVENYNTVNSNINLDIKRWSTYPFDLTDRINVVKMNILPRLLFLFQSLPIEIPPKQYIEWDRMISRFIWEGKKPRIRYATLQLPKDKGGMSLPNLKLYFFAAQMCYICCWCDSEYYSRWKEIETCVSEHPIQTLLGEEDLPNNITTSLNPITTYTMELWQKVARQLKLKKEKKILKWIYLDKDFKPAKDDSTFNQWRTKVVTAFATITNKNKMRDFQDLKVEFGLTNHDFFRYLQVREYFNKAIRSEEGSEQNPVLEVIIGAYQHKTSKTISKLYRSLISCQKNTTLYVKEKWEKEMSITISEKEWYSTCASTQSSTTSLKWREFNWKNLMRFFITPSIKSKLSANPQMCWRQCGAVNANHSHIFWNCSQIGPFWHSIHHVLTNALRYTIPFKQVVLHLGNISETVIPQDQYLVKIFLIAARKAITRRWLKPEPPTLTDWTEIVEEIYIMEKMTFVLRLREGHFKEKWDRYIITHWSMYDISGMVADMFLFFSSLPFLLIYFYLLLSFFFFPFLLFVCKTLFV